MKLTVVGFWGGYPKGNGASSGYILEHDDFHLCIDFGSGVLSQIQNFIQPEDIDGVILSHYHPDHIADIGVLQHARLIQTYLGKEMDCLPIYGHPYDEREFAKLTYKQLTKGVAFEEGKPLEIGPFTVYLLRTNHPVPCFAMRLEMEGKSIVYTGDTSFKEELISFSKGTDLLLCECSFYSYQNGKNAGHMNSLDAGKLAKEAEVKQLMLTHLPHYGNVRTLVEEAATIYNGVIQLADYGKSIII